MTGHGNQPLYSNTLNGVALRTQGGYLHVVTLTAAAADATLLIYDNASSATGNPIAAINVAAKGTASVNYFGLEFRKGLWAVMTGTGAQVVATIN